MNNICYFCLNDFNISKKNYHPCNICIDKYCHEKCWEKYKKKNVCPCCRQLIQCNNQENNICIIECKKYKFFFIMFGFVIYIYLFIFIMFLFIKMFS